MTSELFDESGYRALRPIPLDQVKVGMKVLVPHWHRGEITGYDVTTVTHSDPNDREGYVLCDNGQGYYRYSLAHPYPTELRLTITLCLSIDTQAYARDYGMKLAQVPADARTHMEATVTEVAREQLTRLGYAEILASSSTITEE